MKRNVATVIAALLLLAARSTAAQTVPGWQTSRPWLRAEWFERQRAYPLPAIPDGARLRALAELGQMKRLAPEVARRPRWRPLGPQPVENEFGFMTASGRVTALAVDPRNAATVYLGAAEGGVWKTTDSGVHWRPLTDDQPSLSIGSIALDPQNPSTVYVGTGEANLNVDRYAGAGILKSTDGGASWAQICGPFCGAYGPYPQDGGASIAGIAVHPTDGNVLLAAALTGVNLDQGGIYRSNDGGGTWTQVLSGNGGEAVLFDPSDGSIAYAALGNDYGAPPGGREGIFKSTNGGQTWSPDNGSGAQTLPLANAGRIVLAIAPSAPHILFASISASLASIGDINLDPLLGMFKTADGGAHWRKLAAAPDYCLGLCWYDNVIAVDPTNPKIVFAGGTADLRPPNLVRSLDGGNSWVNIDPNGTVHNDMHALAFSADGSVLYLGSEGGVWNATQPAAAPSFTQRNSTLSITQFYAGIGVDPASGLAIGGTEGNGTLISGARRGWEWQLSCSEQGCAAVCGDGGYTAVAPRSNILYAACAAPPQGIRRSLDGGAHWTFIPDAFNGERSLFVAPLVIDPRRGETLYFGTYRVWQTRDRGNRWTPISPDLTDDYTFGVSVVTTIAPAPSNSNAVYAATGDGNVWATTNAGAGAGANWRQANAGLPPRWVTSLAIDPKDPKIAYVAFSGFSGFVDTLGHVFATTNAGDGWSDISGNLPNIPVNAVVLDPAKPERLFIGTDVGCFYSGNRGKSWLPLGTGLPNVAVIGLTLEAASGSETLIAATHGRGAWALPVP